MTASQQETQLFLAFVDGVFDYVCAECTALCCKGHGFGGSLAREMPQLFQIYPRLASSTLGRKGNIVDMMTPAAGCHFLEPDNMCGIERRHGKSLKPGICALFPFNDLRRIGSTITVRPHFLCPLRIRIPARVGEVEGTHDRVVPSVFESGLLDADGKGAQLTPVPLHPALSPRAVIEREAAFRDACAGAIGRLRFMDVVAGQENVRRRVARLLWDEVPETSTASDACDELMFALASPLRLSLLKLSSDGILRTLALAEMFVRRDAGLSGRGLDPQSAFNRLTTLIPLLMLLGHGDEALDVTRASSVKSPPFGDPMMTFAAFRVSRALASGSVGVLETLDGAIDPAMAATDRQALIMALGAQFEPLMRKRRVSG